MAGYLAGDAGHDDAPAKTGAGVDGVGLVGDHDAARRTGRSDDPPPG